MKHFFNKTGLLILIACITFLTQSCLSEEDEVAPSGSDPDFILSYSFSSGLGDWETGFTEYPISAADTMQIDASLINAQGELNIADSLLRLSAIDPVADLFSFIKLKVTGLTPSTNFSVLIETEFIAANLDTLGTTYSGDQKVHLKAGVFEIEPLVVDAEDSLSVGYSYTKLDIDKGNNDVAGNDMVLLGTINMPDPSIFTQLLQANNIGKQLTTQSDADGNMWLLIGTDSETKMHQAFYYNRIAVIYDEID